MFYGLQEMIQPLFGEAPENVGDLYLDVAEAFTENSECNLFCFYFPQGSIWIPALNLSLMWSSNILACNLAFVNRRSWPSRCGFIKTSYQQMCNQGTNKKAPLQEYSDKQELFLGGTTCPTIFAVPS